MSGEESWMLGVTSCFPSPAAAKWRREIRKPCLVNQYNLLTGPTRTKSTSRESSGQYGNRRRVAHLASYPFSVAPPAAGRRCRTYSTWWTWMETTCSVWRSTTFLSCAPVGRNVIRMPGWFAKVIISLWRTQDVCVWRNDKESSLGLELLCCFCWGSRKLWYEEESADTTGLHGAEPNGGHGERGRPRWPVDQPGSYGLQPNAGTSTC